LEEWEAKLDVMHRYDLTAHIYDIRYAEEQIEKIETATKRIRMKNQDFILDVGCGTGLLFNYIPDRVETIVGIDISRKTLLQAKENTRRMKNLYLISADADNIPLKNEIFSHIFAITLLQNMPNSKATLSEIKRVAKEKAFIIITGLKKKYSLNFFKNLLKKNGLNIIYMTSEGLKCHVAVCKENPP
jgi:ubiquinone/menaquinone biosynthesis C-methylase UbiE